MAITRIDCHFFRGQGLSPEQTSYVGLNPSQRPGSMVMAGASAVSDSIGSHVACKLALQHFVEGVLDFLAASSTSTSSAEPSTERGGREEQIPSLELLENAFKSANNSVYAFGHKLAAGGRLAASLLGVVIEDNAIACGRVGQGNAYLCRGGEIFPFFETLLDRGEGSGTDGYLGSQSVVSVELASVPLEPYDILFLSAESLDAFGERELHGVLEDLGLTRYDELGGRAPSAFACDQVVQALYTDPSQVAFAMLAVAGPDTFYLTTPVRDTNADSAPPES